MVNPNDSRQMRRLCQARRWSQRALAPFRSKRLEILEQLVGRNYSDNGAKRAVPINLIELAMNIYSRQLAAHNPRTLITTQVPELKVMAAELMVVMDHLYGEINLSSSLQMCVIDSLMSIGILKVGITPMMEDEFQGYRHDGGQAFADPVHLDDWVHDMTARKFEQCQYMGNRYRILLDEFNENKTFKKPDVVVASEMRVKNEEGDERASNISRGGSTSDEAIFQDTVELWDIWLPKEGLVLTFLDGSAEESLPVRIVEWDGPEQGPFHMLSFNPIPDNTMPLAPAALWKDLHELANVVFRKLGRQAESQKTVTGYGGSAEDDAGRLKDASDGEIIRMDDPQSVNKFQSGGIDQVSLAFFLQIRDLFSYFGGNLDSIGGLSAQSETLGQDELLSASASQRINDMQETMATFTRDVVKSLAWYTFTDPVVDKNLVRTLPSAPSFEIPFNFSPETREGDFVDYNFDIQPYSLSPQTPGNKLRAITQVFNQFVAPMIPVMQAQGITIDFTAMFETISEYANTPEIKNMLMFTTGEPLDPGEQAVTGGVKRTESVRINKPGSTRQGKDKAMMGFLTGNGVQPDEAAAVGRPTT